MPLDKPRGSRYSSPLDGRSRSRVRDGVKRGGEVGDVSETSTTSSSGFSGGPLVRGIGSSRHHSRDSVAGLRVRVHPLSPPYDLPYRPGRGLRLSPNRGRSRASRASSSRSRHERAPSPQLRSPRAWPSMSGPDWPSAFPRRRLGVSPPLAQSLDGRPRRHSSLPASPPPAGSSGKSRSRVLLPEGVVVFPLGNMLATASIGVTDPSDMRSHEFTFGRRSPGGNLGTQMEVVPRPLFLPEDIVRLESHFEILCPVFPVRCKYMACATLRGPCKELWVNMITVPGKYCHFHFFILLLFGFS